MTTFTEDQQKHMSAIVTFMMTWMRHQNVWLAAPAGSYAEEKAVEEKRFYASLAHRSCIKLGANPIETIGTPACQDANEYDRQIMKAVEAERAA
jgi:hypothetical protein